MKIAIATVDKNKNSEISSRAGRAPHFLIFNENKELLEVLPNPFSMGGGGAGMGVAKMLADKEINIFIAGKVGGNMVEALEERGVKYYEKNGIAKDALSEI